MGELLVVAFLGGLITGLSPCIVPVIPVVMAGGATDSSKARPYVIIGGLVVSFSLSVLFATSVLSFLHLPADLLFWLGVALLGLLSIGLLVPRVGEVIERPFARLGVLALRHRGRRLRARAQPGPRVRPVRGPRAHGDLGGGGPPPGGRDVAARHSLLRRRRHHPSTGAGGSGPARHDVVVVVAQPPAHGPQGRRRGARRGHLGDRLQLARRPAAGRPRVHDGARRPRRVHRHGLHAAPTVERRAPEPVRRGQRTAGGEEGDVRRDRLRQLGERASRHRHHHHDHDHDAPDGHRRREEAARLHGQQDQPAEPGTGPQLHRHHGLVQHTGQPAAEPELPEGQGGARRLLDLLVHQLPALVTPCRGLVQRLQEGRARRRRGVGTRVRLRARGLQRGERGRKPGHRLPGRRGRQPGDLDGLQQRVLAGGVPHRPDRGRARLRLR